MYIRDDEEYDIIARWSRLRLRSTEVRMSMLIDLITVAVSVAPFTSLQSHVHSSYPLFSLKINGLAYRPVLYWCYVLIHPNNIYEACSGC